MKTQSPKYVVTFLLLTSFFSQAQVSDSPESMYEWRYLGIVMSKEIHQTTPRAGYVILKNGKRLEGELQLKKKAGVLNQFEIKTSSGKEKLDPKEVSRYGYTVSVAEVEQENLEKATKQAGKRPVSGAITTKAGESQRGYLTLVNTSSKPGIEKIIFQGADRKYVEYTPAQLTSFFTQDGPRNTKYIAIDSAFVQEAFNGKKIQAYLNPYPTTVNRSATSIAQSSVGVGTRVAATAMVNADEKENNYTTNLDSIIAVSSTEELIDLRKKWASLAGYNTPEEAIERSSNESLKNNLSALGLAIDGQTASDAIKILNQEWIILDKTTGKKQIVYKSDYKDQIEELLLECDGYIAMEKGQQNDLRKWDNFEEALRLLDNCQ